MTGPAVERLASLDLRSADAVVRLLEEGAAANRDAACRDGSIDRISAPGALLATGDLHDNPLHLARALDLAALDDAAGNHLTLHEVIHGSALVNGMDLSHRALARVAFLKSAYPEQVHALLANHELSQIVGLGVVKDGVRMNQAFDEGVEFVFGGDAPRVLDAVGAFIRSMPLALVSGQGTDAGLLAAHSLPGPDLLDRFDPAVLERAMTEDDYTPRRGSAHIMVWGRGHDDALLGSLSDRWGVRLFVLGHEKAPNGWLTIGDRAIVLNSDHERGVALPIDLASPPTPPLEPSVRAAAVPLAAS